MSIIYDALNRVDKKPSRGQDNSIKAKKISIKKLILPFFVAVAGATLLYTWQTDKPVRQISASDIALETIPVAKKKPLKKLHPALADKPQSFVVRDPFSKTSPFKLSGIIYSSDKPVAIVNGKTVNIGELIGEAKVSNIKEDSVELSLNDEKIILTLE